MTKTFRDGKSWRLQLVLAGLIVWLAQGILIDNGDSSEVAYAAGLAPQGPEDRTPVVIERAPLRTIRDPYPSFSAVAVNSDHDMLVVTDQNLFQILEYDSRADTPPAALFTEPRRVISGTNTFAEMMCGVYVDPETLEIYALNNDTQGWIPVFSPDARGNATPTRVLAGVRGFGITMHEERQEMFIANQNQHAVLVYRKQAEGNEEPLRVLQGGDTQLADPHGIAIDLQNNLIFVSNFGNARVRLPDAGEESDFREFFRRDRSYGKFLPPSITVYPLEASGNTEPLWTIEGPNTLMNWPSHLAIHQQRQELFVANDAADSVLVFRTSDKGDAAPIRVIQGPNTGIRHPPGITVDEKLDEIYVANMGNASVTVFPVTANGDVRPLRTVRGGPLGRVALNIGNPGGVAYDTTRGEILVLN